MTSSFPSGSMSIWQFSMPSGWQNGIRSCVRFAAMTPAMTAVSMIGPFSDANPGARRVFTISAGKRTRASAMAVRSVIAFSPTSTMVGRLRSSIWVSFAMSAADVIHLDLAQRMFARAQARAQFAVAVGPFLPHAAHDREQVHIVRAAAQRAPQVGARSREETGVEPAVRREPRARAGTAEGFAHRGNEADFAGAVEEAIALRDFAVIVLRDRFERPVRGDRFQYFMRGHNALAFPVIPVA